MKLNHITHGIQLCTQLDNDKVGLSKHMEDVYSGEKKNTTKYWQCTVWDEVDYETRVIQTIAPGDDVNKRYQHRWYHKHFIVQWVIINEYFLRKPESTNIRHAYLDWAPSSKSWGLLVSCLQHSHGQLLCQWVHTFKHGVTELRQPLDAFVHQVTYNVWFASCIQLHPWNEKIFHFFLPKSKEDNGKVQQMMRG